MSLRFKCSGALLVFAVLWLTSCSLIKTKGDSANSSSSSKEGGSLPSRSDSSSRTATSFSPSSDARTDVREALLRLKTAYPYRLTETSSMSGTAESMPETTRVVEFAAAHRSHMKWTGGPGGDIEAISIDDNHYWFSDGKWIKGTVPSQLGYRGEDFSNKLAEMVKEVKYLGPDSVNGLSCHAYTGTFETTLGGQQWIGTAKVWIGADDGLIHQSDSEYHVATYTGKSHIVYEYNVNITVEPPAM